MRRRPAPAAARPPICRWWRCRRPRSSGWSGACPQIEDILPLSPLQEGLLFHALYDAQAPDVYTVQLVLALAGPLDSAALQAAAQALLAASCQPARAASSTRPEPAGADHRAAGGGCRWRSIDLSVAGRAQREQRLAAILAQERAERFDLAAAPLMRFALIRLAAESIGWCSPTITS